VQVRFVAQPFADGYDLWSFIHAVAADPALTNLDVVVAWAKRSGLSRVEDDLEVISARPGRARMIVGIDEGGATRQGLTLARALFDTVHVFHDRAGRTFHPKVYLGWGDTTALLLVGSHNLTAGGVYFNYEIGLVCELALPGDAPLFTDVQQYIARLHGDASACKQLTDDVLAELIANPRYRVDDEDTRHTPAVAGAPEELDAEVDVETKPDPPGWSPSIFGGSAEAKKPDPGTAVKKASAAKKAAATKKAAAGRAPPPGPVPTAAAAVQKRWFKRMSYSDAQQQKTAATNVKGVLTLGKAGHPIDQTTYFRTDFFAPLAWSATNTPNGVKESATVSANVFVNGTQIGQYDLTIDHADSRIAGQGNTPTWLHWDAFGLYLRTNNHVENYVTIERLTNGSFRILIDPNPAGPFIA